MRICDWSSDVCSSDLFSLKDRLDVSLERSQRSFEFVRGRGNKMGFDLVHFPELRVGLLELFRIFVERLVRFGQFRDRFGELALDEIGRASCRERVYQYV